MTGAILKASFGESLLDSSRSIPDGLTSWNGSDPAQRFGVYRNNVVVSLTEALAAKFPVVRELTGDEFFRAMARLYVIENPPRSRLLAEYGESLPLFIEQFPPATDLPYLADVARLEAARTVAFHAVDEPSLKVEAFASLNPANLDVIGVRLHPSASILTSRFAVFSLWAAHQGAVDIGSFDPSSPEDVLIVRPDYAVEVTRLGSGQAAFLQALQTGNDLATAASIAVHETDKFDLAAALQVLISTGVGSAFHWSSGAKP